jgi:hypothetical protein
MTNYEIELIQEQGEADKIQPSEFENFVTMMRTRQTHLSFSSIKNFIPVTGGTPYGFMKYKLKKTETTDAMNLGKLIDKMLLTPDTVAEDVVIAPTGAAFNSLDGIGIYAKWLGGLVPDFDPKSIESLKAPAQKKIVESVLEVLERTKTVVSTKDYQLAQYISNRVLKNEYVHDIIKYRTPESAQSNVEFHKWGWNWRGKTDLTLDYAGYRYKNGLVVDMKLMVDASPRAAQWTIRSEFYSGQGAIYTKGSGLDVPFMNICYDRNGGVSIIEHSERAIEGAWNDLETYMKEFNSMVSMSEILPGCWFRSHDFWGDSDGIHHMQ